MLESLLLPYDILGRYLLVLSFIVLLAIVWSLGVSVPRLFHTFSRPSPLIVAGLVAVILVSGYVKIFVYPHSFGLYLDDYYPLEIANKVLMHDFNRLDPIFVANGALFLPSFLLFGITFKVGMYTMILLSILSLLLFFVLCHLLTKNWTTSLLATACMSLYASHVHYAFSAYNHTPVFFFTVLALVCYFSYFESKDAAMLYASMFSVLYLVLMRIEMLLLPVFLFTFYIYRKKPHIKEMMTWVPWLVFGIGIVMLLPRLLFFADDLGNHPEIAMNSVHFFKNAFLVSGILDIGHLMVILALAGLSLCVYRKNSELLLVFLMAFLLLLLHLFMSYEQIQDARHLHFPAAIILLLASVSVSFFISLLNSKKSKTIMVAIILFGILIFGVSQHNSLAKVMKADPLSNQIYFDTRLPKSAAALIPSDCIVVTPHPSKYSATTRIRAIPIEYFLPIPKAQLKDTCYVFADDLSCVYPLQNVEGKCDSIRKKYGLSYLGKVDSSQIPTPNRNLRINATFYYIKP